MAALLGLHGTNSGIPISSIASFAANTNTNTETAYKRFCKDLLHTGVTEAMIQQKEDKILEILRSQGMVAESRIGCSDIGDLQDQVLEMAYKVFLENLYQIGATEDMILPKAKILEVLRSRGVVASSQTGSSSKIEDNGQLSEAGYSQVFMCPATDFTNR